MMAAWTEGQWLAGSPVDGQREGGGHQHLWFYRVLLLGFCREGPAFYHLSWY